MRILGVLLDRMKSSLILFCLACRAHDNNSQIKIRVLVFRENGSIANTFPKKISFNRFFLIGFSNSIVDIHAWFPISSCKIKIWSLTSSKSHTEECEHCQFYTRINFWRKYSHLLGAFVEVRTFFSFFFFFFFTFKIFRITFSSMKKKQCGISLLKMLESAQVEQQFLWKSKIFYKSLYWNNSLVTVFRGEKCSYSFQWRTIIRTKIIVLKSWM